jgi:hypothetical protein
VAVSPITAVGTAFSSGIPPLASKMKPAGIRKARQLATRGQVRLASEAWAKVGLPIRDTITTTAKRLLFSICPPSLQILEFRESGIRE